MFTEDTTAQRSSEAVSADLETLSSQRAALLDEFHAAQNRERDAARAGIVRAVAVHLGADEERLGAFLAALVEVTFVGEGQITNHLVNALDRVNSTNAVA